LDSVDGLHPFLVSKVDYGIVNLNWLLTTIPSAEIILRVHY